MLIQNISGFLPADLKAKLAERLSGGASDRARNLLNKQFEFQEN
jgi:hypothetical protein